MVEFGQKYLAEEKNEELSFRHISIALISGRVVMHHYRKTLICHLRMLCKMTL
jgi:hypothetical protein